MACTVFIFGLGYVGRPLGHLLARQGWRIRGTTRTPERLAAETEAGWQIHRFSDDIPLADPAAALDGVDAVLSTITAIGGSDPVLDAHGDVLSGFTGWSGYVSATSVYPTVRTASAMRTRRPTRPRSGAGPCHRRSAMAGTSRNRAFPRRRNLRPGRSPFDPFATERRASSNIAASCSTASMSMTSAASSSPR